MIKEERQLPARGRVAVVGTTGHTGRFVTTELLRRGFPPIAIGRNAAKLESLRAIDPELETRLASTDDPQSLLNALDGVSLVINCAGPFLDTAGPVVEAALATGAHYLDVTAEQAAARDTFATFDARARKAGVLVMPAIAFYGGLADLMASALLDNWTDADSLEIRIALDSWHPTHGTRVTGQRNTVPRLMMKNGRLVQVPHPAPEGVRDFPAPFGRQDVIALPFSEIAAIAKHLRVPNVSTVINRAPIMDIRNPDTPPPRAVTDDGRSNQIFMLDVLAARGAERRRATASGQDIYATTAPIVVEAAVRILNGRVRVVSGARAAGEVFAAAEFLEALRSEYFSIAFSKGPVAAGETP